MKQCHCCIVASFYNFIIITYQQIESANIEITSIAGSKLHGEGSQGHAGQLRSH